jgi:abhydrolase domain-containing protein 6
VTPQPVRRKGIPGWGIALAILLVLVVSAAVFVYEDPFWLVDRSVKMYLSGHDVHNEQVTVDSHQIHYLEAKSIGGSGRTLVLVHGLGARATDWAPLIPRFTAAGYHVYALDLLGYGDSDKPADGDFSIRGEEKTVLDFMHALNIPQADVAGWSMGGWVAMRMALDHPETVRRLVLYDSAGLYFDFNFPMTLFSPSNRAELDALTLRLEPDRPRLHVPAFAVHGLLRKFKQNKWIIDRSLSSMLAGPDILDFRVSNLKMPVLIMWGTEDKLIPFTLAEHMHDVIPQSVLVGVPACGHLAPAECATQFVPSTVKFLDAEPPLGPSKTMLEPLPVPAGK